MLPEFYNVARLDGSPLLPLTKRENTSMANFILRNKFRLNPRVPLCLLGGVKNQMRFALIGKPHNNKHIFAHLLSVLIL